MEHVMFTSPSLHFLGTDTPRRLRFFSSGRTVYFFFSPCSFSRFLMVVEEGEEEVDDAGGSDEK